VIHHAFRIMEEARKTVPWGLLEVVLEQYRSGVASAKEGYWGSQF
jgi:hypothetical protein